MATRLFGTRLGDAGLKSYEPYKFDGMKALMQRAYRMGWYPGKHDLLKITVTMQGSFEGWSGRATESWEQHFIVEFMRPRGPNAEEQVYCAEGLTLDEACQAILKQMM